MVMRQMTTVSPQPFHWMPLMFKINASLQFVSANTAGDVERGEAFANGIRKNTPSLYLPPKHRTSVLDDITYHREVLSPLLVHGMRPQIEKGLRQIWHDEGDGSSPIGGFRAGMLFEVDLVEVVDAGLATYGVVDEMLEAVEQNIRLITKGDDMLVAAAMREVLQRILTIRKELSGMPDEVKGNTKDLPLDHPELRTRVLMDRTQSKEIGIIRDAEDFLSWFGGSNRRFGYAVVEMPDGGTEIRVNFGSNVNELSPAVMYLGEWGGSVEKSVGAGQAVFDPEDMTLRIDGTGRGDFALYDGISSKGLRQRDGDVAISKSAGLMGINQAFRAVLGNTIKMSVES